MAEPIIFDSLEHLIEESGMIIKAGDKQYYFLPFYFEEDHGGYIMHRLDNLPEDLKQAITDVRLGKRKDKIL